MAAPAAMLGLFGCDGSLVVGRLAARSADGCEPLQAQCSHDLLFAWSYEAMLLVTNGELCEAATAPASEPWIVGQDEAVDCRLCASTYDVAFCRNLCP